MTKCFDVDITTLLLLVLFAGSTLLDGVEGSECKPYEYGNELKINVTSTVQNLSTPGYPTSYAHKLNCYWLLKLTSGHTLFMYIHTHAVRCPQDYLLINNGPIGSDNPTYNGCWNNRTETIINVSKSTGIRFESDMHDNDKGFVLYFSNNKQTLQTYINGLESGTGSGNGNNGGSGNANNTGGTNGTLGDSNASTQLATKNSSIIIFSYLTTIFFLKIFLSFSR